MSTPTFERLLAEGEKVPVEGWDFSWFDGRATEQRPSWGYARMLPERVGHARAVLDVQTGGGEVFAEVLTHSTHLPAVRAATEGWPPNLPLARGHLSPFGATVLETAARGALPFADRSLDLVTSRHPTVTGWAEVARVLSPGGTFLSQQVGAGSMRELTDAMMGPQPVGDARSPRRAAEAATAAGLTVVDLRHEALRTEFYDIAAVVHYLRKVVWIVPGFSVAHYRDRLAVLHRHITTEGSFVAHAQRFLIEARKG